MLHNVFAEQWTAAWAFASLQSSGSPVNNKVMTLTHLHNTARWIPGAGAPLCRAVAVPGADPRAAVLPVPSVRVHPPRPRTPGVQPPTRPGMSGRFP